MTRKEEIKLYLKERNIPFNSLEANSIIEGIEWVNKNMLDKACEWLEETIDEDVLLIKCGNVIKCMNAVEFSEYFRKAMEE